MVRNTIKAGDGENINHVWQLQLNGTLLPFKGSPDSTGAFWTAAGYPPDETFTIDKELRNLEAKKTAISDLFSVEGGLLEFQPWDGGPQIKCNPRIDDIRFDEGVWVSQLNYSISMTAPHILYEGALGSGYLAVATIKDYNVSSINDSWNVELNEEEEFWTIKHDLSAKGDRVFDINGVLLDEPWHEARRWCLNQSTSGVLPDFAGHTDPLTSGLMGFVGYNYGRVSSPNKHEGTYNLSETWVATSGNRSYLESFEVNYSRNNEDGMDVVAINGEIRGLDFTTRIPFAASGKIAAANIAFSGIWSQDYTQDITYKRAKQHSEIIDLNPIPRSESIAKREKLGTINYSREYDSRPTNYISGSLIEHIDVQDKFPTKIRPTITIPGRAGILFQDVGSNTPATRNISVTVVMNRRKEPYASLISGVANYALLPRPNVSGLLLLFLPPGIDGYNYNLVENGENWQPQKLRLEKSYQWTSNVL